MAARVGSRAPHHSVAATKILAALIPTFTPEAAESTNTIAAVASDEEAATPRTSRTNAFIDG